MRAWAACCKVVRMNMRNCCDTYMLPPTLYHSGLSGEVGLVADYYTRQFGLERVALPGCSMGGNLVLKVAGEWGNRPPLCAVAAICPAIDLAADLDAVHETMNRLCEWHFLLGLMRRFRRKAALFPSHYDPDCLWPVRFLRQFDHRIRARYGGFRDARDYHYRGLSSEDQQRFSDGAMTFEDALQMATHSKKRIIAHAQRWIDHYTNRIAYERAMLGDQGGTVAEKTGQEKGGAVRCWCSPGYVRGWSYIVKVNKVSVSVLDNWGNGGVNFSRTFAIKAAR